MSEYEIRTEIPVYNWANHETRDTVDIEPTTLDIWRVSKGMTLSAEELGCKPGQDFRLSLYRKSTDEYDDERIDSFDTTAE